MSSGSSSGQETPDQSGQSAQTPRPDWADGLRQLYDSVVDEPLPDAFKDLLERLDGDGSSDGQTAADGSDGGHG